MLISLSATVVAGQDPLRIAPGRWFVSLDREVPTQRALMALLKERAAGRVLQELRQGVPLTSRDAVVLMSGAAADTGPARRVVLGEDVSLFVTPARLRQTLERLHPGVARLAVLGSSGDWAGAAAEVVAVADAHGLLEARCDAVLIPDDPAVLRHAESVLRAAEQAGVPAVTTAPWLARASCAMGVVPDLDAAALQLDGRLDGSVAAVPAVPTETTVHLDGWRRTGLALRPDRMAWAHRVYGVTP